MISLHYADCLEVLPSIASGSVDLILCDLPYGVTRNKWDSIIPLDVLWSHYRRISCGPIVLTAVQPFAARLIASNFDQFKYEWIWQKREPTGFLNANKMPLRSHENILVFYDKLPLYRPQMTKCEPYTVKRKGTTAGSNYGEVVRPDVISYDQHYPRSVITFPKDKQQGSFHPTQKPTALMEYLIQTYTDQGSLILDNTMGSGTTGVAAVNLKRSFIGIEKEKEYFDVAEWRIAMAQAEAMQA